MLFGRVRALACSQQVVICPHRCAPAPLQEKAQLRSVLDRKSPGGGGGSALQLPPPEPEQPAAAQQPWGSAAGSSDAGWYAPQQVPPPQQAWDGSYAQSSGG